MTFVITDLCVDIKDKKCVTECPVDCIYEGPRSLYIHPDECIDCGACEPVCPVAAIVPDYQLDDETRPALVRAEELFARVGRPNGAKRHGPLPDDHESVAVLPPRPAEAS